MGLTRRQMLLTTLAAAGGAVLAGCGGGGRSETGTGAATGSAGFPVTIEGKLGAATIPQAPQRVVSVGYTDHDAILASSRLLQHRETQLIKFTAPDDPGEYEFVSTFPGHAERMRGVLVVE